MISRRRFLNTTAGLAAASAIDRGAAAAQTSTRAKVSQVKPDDPLHWVDPRIGTGGHGHCFPGAAVPFGAVQLSPDTYNDGWDWCSGYHISDSSIMGFSHTHLSGTGCGDLLDFLVMAGTGTAKVVPGTRDHPEQGYRSRFDHADETCTPGYYAVLLKDYAVRAEMTATERTGLHRYTFPATGGAGQPAEAYLILDLQHGYEGGGQPNVLVSNLFTTAPDTFAGGRTTRAWGNGRHVYFTMQVSKAPVRTVLYLDDKPVEAPSAQLIGKNVKCVLYFTTAQDEAILVRTGISAVSPENAALNLETEQPDWNFEKVQRAARDKWAKQIGKVSVQTKNEDHKRVFYTALYHLSLGPTLFDDVDGRYRGMDGGIRSLPKGAHNYTTFSLWDTFRAAHPAYTLIEPARVPDFANSLVRMANESAAGMPVWPLQGTETGTMTGYHSAAVIAEAINKGFPGIDTKGAYRVMMQRASVDNFQGMTYYREKSYIPADRESESVSKAFEYCYDDWAIAHVAKRLAKKDDAAMLRDRSTNYKNFFDPKTGFMRAKLANGTWAGSWMGVTKDGKPTGVNGPFNPIALGHFEGWRDYTESNSWQTTFGVQHDPAGLIALFGGREAFLTKLDGLFDAAPDVPVDAPPDIAGVIGQYAHGNEPSHHIAYLYVYAGAPHKTQARVRGLLDTMYSAAPDGLAGNEDVGQMSAWYFLSALGFYPVDPVSGNYILGSPLFEHATVNLGNGRNLIVDVRRSDPAHQYIHAFTMNGRPQRRAWFNHSEIAQGGRIVLQMSAEPNLEFATEQKNAPPSLVL